MNRSKGECMICKILGHKWLNPDSTIMMFKCGRCGYNTWEKGYLFNIFCRNKIGWKIIFLYYRIKSKSIIHGNKDVRTK